MRLAPREIGGGIRTLGTNDCSHPVVPIAQRGTVFWPRESEISDPAFWRPAEPIAPVGDNRKARDLLGWSPTTRFAGLVDMLIEADLADVDGDPQNRGDPTGSGKKGSYP